MFTIRGNALVIILIVTGILAVAVVGYAFVVGRESDGGANEVTTLTVTNVAVRSTSEAGRGNSNASVDTSGWETYTNEEYGYSFQYPSGWLNTYVYYAVDPLEAAPGPIHYSVISSPDSDYALVLGIQRVGDEGTIYYRTGIGAGDIQKGKRIAIGDMSVDSWELTHDDRVHEIFLYPVEEGPRPNVIGDHEVIASISIEDPIALVTESLTEVDEYRTFLSILRSLRFRDGSGVEEDHIVSVVKSQSSC